MRSGMAIDPVRALEACGWTLARKRKHEIWRCPCGKHQMTLSKTPSDERAYKNFVRDLLKHDCKSLDPIRPKEAEAVEPGVCVICGRELPSTTFKRDWIRHDGVCVCLSHHGVKKWSRGK